MEDVNGGNFSPTCIARTGLTATDPSILPPPFSNPTSSPPAVRLWQQKILVSPFTSSPIILHVGGAHSPSAERQPVRFYVHIDLLTNISPFFRAAFAVGENGFSESHTGMMYLPQERPDDIRFLLQWIYHRAFTALAARPDTEAETGHACPLMRRGPEPAINGLWHALIDPVLIPLRKYYRERKSALRANGQHGTSNQPLLMRPPSPAFGPLVRLWLLAERYDIGILKDEIVERFRQVAEEGNCVPGQKDIWMLWEGVLSGPRNRLKDLICDLYAGLKCRTLLVDGEVEEWHPGFLRDLCAVLMQEVEDWARKSEEVEAGAKKSSLKREDVNQSAPPTANSGGLTEEGAEAKGTTTTTDSGSGWIMVGKLRRRACAYHEHCG